MSNLKNHWETVYESKDAEKVSWYQKRPDKSLDWIQEAAPDRLAAIIDVGGGASKLVDNLLEEGWSNLTVLDISASALRVAKNRLAGKSVQWIEGDIISVNLSKDSFDLWHDRAAFHFLTAAEDRRAYVNQVLKALKPGGHMIIATFATDGPEKCSNLPIARYSAELLSDEFGDNFRLIRQERDSHFTPGGSEQKFIYCHFIKS